jgi:signal transduction histidine kinase
MPPTDGPTAATALEPAPAEAWLDPGTGGWPDAEGRAQTLERLIGVRSSKPSFYAAWRDNSARLDRTIETLERISTALCAPPEGPEALCDAVVEAAAHHFDAPWAALCFTGVAGEAEPWHVVRRVAGRITPVGDDPPPVLQFVMPRALQAAAPVFLVEAPTAEAPRAVAAPMPVRGGTAGVLAVGLLPDAVVASTDLSILVTLANQAGVALRNARRSQELEGIRLRLQDAGRRELLSQERNRIARELHDSVAQHLLTIGMNLEWCRRQDATSEPVLERVSASQSLARAAVDEIRSVIFGLANDDQIDLRRALREVVNDVVADSRLQVSLRTYGQAEPISGAARHALLQIAREALFNVVRHAGAARAWLSLRWRPGEVQLVIGDDGTGDAGELQTQLHAPEPAERHFGLASIAGRVGELAGGVAFQRRRGGGVSLIVQLPLGGPGVVR